MAFDYGKFLVVDLAEGSSSTKLVPEQELKKYFGGGGLGAKLFFDEQDPSAIVIANGLLTGFTVPTACKTSILFHSPLTGVFGESSVGGKWGAELKKTGYDGFIVKGNSADPVYLFVSDNGVEIRPAQHLWGKDTFAAHKRLQEELPRGSQIGLIGPAGEREVLFASMMFEGELPRAAGRTGIGCVFGQKKIKAIAVKGGQRPRAVSEEELREYVRELNRSIKEKTSGFHALGTTGKVAFREKSGDLPIKNFSQDAWEEGAQKITGQTYIESMFERHTACFMCPIACGKAIKIKKGRHQGLTVARPEYESAAALGSNLLLDSAEEVAFANMLCNQLGLDTISAGVIIGFLFECVERGIVSQQDVDLKDTEPRWGNADAVEQLVRMIAAREGIGDLLANGVREAARRFGGGSEIFAIHAKGLELPMHDPRALATCAATYATGNRGGSHNESFAYYAEEGLHVAGMGFPDDVDPHTSKGKGELTAQMQNLNAVFDALGLCKFLIAGRVGVDELCRFLLLTTGWKYDKDSLLRVGERIYTFKRLYNQRLGYDGRHDTIPVRLLTEKKAVSQAAQSLPDLELMLKDLYATRGWDEQGRVKKAKIQELELEDYA